MAKLKLVEEAVETDKQKALTAALKQIDQAFGKGSVMRLGEKPLVEIESISTGSLSLDIALGIGGLPKGRIVEIYGPESSGKTTLALHVIAESQKSGGVCAFVDAEHALDPIYARKLGRRSRRSARVAAGHRRASFGNHRYARALRRGRRAGHRLGGGADAARRN